eukprot:6157972-Alexandrium_andersonii.AAC.1
MPYVAPPPGSPPDAAPPAGRHPWQAAGLTREPAVETFIRAKGLDEVCYNRLLFVNAGTCHRIIDQDHWPYSTDNNRT